MHYFGKASLQFLSSEFPERNSCRGVLLAVGFPKLWECFWCSALRSRFFLEGLCQAVCKRVWVSPGHSAKDGEMAFIRLPLALEHNAKEDLQLMSASWMLLAFKLHLLAQTFIRWGVTDTSMPGCPSPELTCSPKTPLGTAPWEEEEAVPPAVPS